MSRDLTRLWAERDAALEAWRQFTEEAEQYKVQDDPVLAALSVPAGRRTDEQHAVLLDHLERQHTLLEAIREAERKVRVAAGHAYPEDLVEGK